MRAILLLVISVALFASVCSADVSVPFTACATNTKATIGSVTASTWPPVKGQAISVTVVGTASETITSGTYDQSVSFGGTPLEHKTGDITKLGVQLPINSGAFTVKTSETVPSFAPSGSYSITMKTFDQSNNALFCMQISFSFASLESLVADATNVDVKYDTCMSNPSFILSSVSASSWPPTRGSTIQLTLHGNMTSDITTATYSSQVLFNGQQIKSKTGSISDFGVKLPLTGAVTVSPPAISVPSFAPTGSFQSHISFTDGTGAQFFCMSVAFTISSVSEETDVPLVSIVPVTTPIDSMVAVAIPFKSCGTSDLLTITSVDTDTWPPKKGSEFLINATALVYENLTGGKYSASISLNGFPVLSPTGDLSKYIKMPVAPNTSYNLLHHIKLSDLIPSGDVSIKASGTDQNGKQLACIEFSFHLS